MLTKAASRKRAQREFPALTACESCGSTSDLQRHHPNLQDALSVVILCQPCHAKAHVARGDWGHGAKKPKTCAVCGREFSIYSHSRVKTCGDTCRSEAGRRAASKRWGTESTDCGDSATRSSRKSRNGSGGASSP